MFHFTGSILVILVLVTGRTQAMDLIDWENRVAGGIDATAPIPYVARIQPTTTLGEKLMICGGAIINTTIILTTATCMYGANGATIIAGTLDPEATAATDPKAQFSKVTQIYYHPSFLRNTMVNDIALLRIEPALNTTETVNIIQLAKSSVIKGDALANKTVVWASFGQINTTNATVLQVATVKPIKSKACSTIHRPGPNFIAVPKTSMCMELSQKSGICAGDLGSPIVYYNLKDKKNPTVPLLAGLAAWNHDGLCPPSAIKSANTPDLFTRIDPFYKWITSMGGPKQL